ncbi:MAG: hypothetical protein ACKOA9_11525 [Actinomycetota bacterium]
MSDNEPNTEVELAGSEIAVPGDAVLAEELTVERSLWRTMMWGMVIATPICIVIWMIIVVLAVGPKDPEDWLAWLGIGAIVGTLAGAFFGGWAGFIKKARVLDEVDARGARH